MYPNQDYLWSAEPGASKSKNGLFGAGDELLSPINEEEESFFSESKTGTKSVAALHVGMLPLATESSTE